MQGRTASMPGRRCPFVTNPFEGCIITNINSQNIDEAIYYCGNNFEECEIYRSRRYSFRNEPIQGMLF